MEGMMATPLSQQTPQQVLDTLPEYKPTVYKPPKPVQTKAPQLVESTAAQGTATTFEVDPNHTTWGLMKSMLDENSDYLKHARNIAKDGMEARGLLSSSMAQGAGVAAAYDAAAPIAQADAGIYANRMTANQQALNEMANANANRATDVSIANAAQANALNMSVAELQALNERSAQQLGLDYARLNQDDQQFLTTLNLNKAKLALDQGNADKQFGLDDRRIGLDDRRLGIEDRRLGIEDRRLGLEDEWRDADLQLERDRLTSSTNADNSRTIGSLYDTYWRVGAQIDSDPNLGEEAKDRLHEKNDIKLANGLSLLNIDHDYTPKKKETSSPLDQETEEQVPAKKSTEQPGERIYEDLTKSGA